MTNARSTALRVTLKAMEAVVQRIESLIGQTPALTQEQIEYFMAIRTYATFIVDSLTEPEDEVGLDIISDSQIAHLMKSPLSGMLGFTQMLISDSDQPLPITVKRDLETFKYQVGVVAALAQTVFDMAWMSADQLAMFGPILPGLVAQIMDEAETLISVLDSLLDSQKTGDISLFVTVRGTPDRIPEAVIRLENVEQVHALDDHPSAVCRVEKEGNSLSVIISLPRLRTML